MKRKYASIPGLTPEQKSWLMRFEGATLMEPMYLEELHSGTMGFDEVARGNIQWFTEFTEIALRQIEQDVPYTG